MKYLKYILGSLFLIGAIATISAFSSPTITKAALTVFQTFQGGIGTSTPSGILYGDNGATTHLNTVTIGAGCTFSGGTLSCAGTGDTFAFPFTPFASYNGTSTTIGFTGGLFSNGSTTVTSIGSGFVGANNGLLYGISSSSLTAASSTLLGDTNTWSGFNTYQNGINTGQGSSVWTIGTTSQSNNNFAITSAGMTYPALTIGTTGNVGVGSTSPDALLSMMDTSGFASVATHLVFEIGSSTMGVATGTLASLTSQGSLQLNSNTGTSNPTVPLLNLCPNANAGCYGIGFANTRASIGYDSNTAAGSLVLEAGSSKGISFEVNTAGTSFVTNTTPNVFISGGNAGTGNVGSVGIGTSSPFANLQVTAAAANATTSMSVGKTGQNKGDCLTFYRTDGTALYGFIPAAATSFTYTTTKPSGCQD